MTKCPDLFCILGPHEDEEHCDATGYCYTKPIPDSEEIAYVYSLD